MTPCRPRPPRTPGRRAFTLVEILVVITIIAVLASLVVAASVGFIGQARAASTRTTIKKVEEAILERVSSVDRWHQRPVQRLQHDWQYRGWDTRWYAKGLNVFANTPSGEQAKLVLSRKGMLLELLPVNDKELRLAYWFYAKFDSNNKVDYVPLGPNPPLNQIFVPYISAAEEAAMNAWLKDTDSTTPGDQSLDTPGEVFYYALTNAPVYGGKRVDEDEFRPSELVDPDKDGLMEIADAWGNPLQFYRWPTRLVNNYPSASSPSWTNPTWGSDVPRKTLMPNAPSVALDLHVDPDDRAGYLAVPNPLWQGAASIAMAFHDPNTWHSPLIVSAGADGKLGLDPPDKEYPFPPVSDPNPPKRYGLAAPIPGEEESLYDNITNHSGNAGSL